MNKAVPPFTKVLIANRGEIAVRIIRACQSLGIATTAVYSEADSNALHVRVADEAYAIGPAPASQSYLNVTNIIAAAHACGAQAIHPGYGFLSERVALAQACAEAGITFVGPSPQAIELMGSKVAAKRLADTVGVPIAPGYMGDDQRPERLRDEAHRLGFPLLIKASAGGGGKGMRVVRQLDDFDDALAAARREALAAFGDDAVLLERLIERPRHIEIQVLADHHGNCVHLFERECSIQRRHQKVIEESPSPVLTRTLREAMGAAAVRLAQAADYVNAGTVEFVYAADESYYFLEMNTRLQVEHPVTELVTGLDLVQLQLQIAAGARLPFTQQQLYQHGHAIEARIYAEDPHSYLPSIGRVALFRPPEAPGIRNDIGLESGDSVSIYYDPMLAKLIVSAEDRQAAIKLLREALHGYMVLGVTTNLPLLRAIAVHPDFMAGDTHTDFLDSNTLIEPQSDQQLAPAEVLAALALADVTYAPAAKVSDPWQVPGWRLMGGRIRRYHSAGQEHTLLVETRAAQQRVRAGERTWLLQSLSKPVEETTALCIHILPETASGALDTNRPQELWLVQDQGGWLIGWQGNSFRVEAAGALDIDALGSRHVGHGGHASLEAPMPGTVIKVMVEEGQQVELHQPLIVLEAMKMEHVVAAPYAGTVQHIACTPGQLVMKGTELVELVA